MVRWSHNSFVDTRSCIAFLSAMRLVFLRNIFLRDFILCFYVLLLYPCFCLFFLSLRAFFLSIFHSIILPGVVSLSFVNVDMTAGDREIAKNWTNELEMKILKLIIQCWAHVLLIVWPLKIKWYVSTYVNKMKDWVITVLENYMD